MLKKKKMGATDVAWAQWFRAELAAESGRPVNYCEAFLDLVKAFDMVPTLIGLLSGKGPTLATPAGCSACPLPPTK